MSTRQALSPSTMAQAACKRVPFSDNQGAIYAIAIGDLNEDGFPDIVAVRSDTPGLVFLSKPGGKKFLLPRHVSHSRQIPLLLARTNATRFLA
jgi:hypothetical protein